jgi:hypothetical protein
MAEVFIIRQEVSILCCVANSRNNKGEAMAIACNIFFRQRMTNNNKD